MWFNSVLLLKHLVVEVWYKFHLMGRRKDFTPSFWLFVTTSQFSLDLNPPINFRSCLRQPPIPSLFKKYYLSNRVIFPVLCGFWLCILGFCHPYLQFGPSLMRTSCFKFGGCLIKCLFFRKKKKGLIPISYLLT